MSKVDLTDFTRKLDAITKAYSKVPAKVAAIAVNFSKERFRDQAWLDETREPWKPRKRNRKGKKRSQTLLVDTGRLKRSIRKISADTTKIVIGTDVPYAQIHNDGGIIKEAVTVKAHRRREHTRARKKRIEVVKAHTVKTHTRKINITIPSRRFIGNSAALQKEIYEHVVAAFAEALKS